MKVPISWLKEYVDLGSDLLEMADKLTMAGLEVEEIKTLEAQAISALGGSGKCEETVFDVKITPNRGDWLSIIGVAQEVATINKCKIKLTEPQIKSNKPSTADCVKISINDPDLCNRYVGIVVRNVKIKESPDWMKDRLVAAGMRPINNIVDITNYIMMELGQPLHAFDLSLLHGSEIIVRRAKAGEKITSIDNTERELEPNMLVIADKDRPVAIAGVMGGVDSEIRDTTKDILIESANFDAVNTRRTAKKLNMSTEASYRFERSVDPLIAPYAALRAAQLISEFGDGEIAEGMLDVYPNEIKPLEIDVRPSRVNEILGTELTSDQMVELLGLVHIDCKLNGDKISCNVPTFRADITREIDLVEEVGRAYGYENFGMTLPDKSLQGKDSPEGLFRAKLRSILMACGAQEVLTHSVIDKKLIGITGVDGKRLPIRNPLSEDLDSMRPMLIPNLLFTVERNQSFQESDVSLFEIGKIYQKTESDEIDEKLSVAGALVGNIWANGWSLPKKDLEVDFYTCKGLVESLLANLGIKAQRVKFEVAREKILHPTRGARILVDGSSIGILGEASPEAVELFGLRGRPCVYEIDFCALMSKAEAGLEYTEIPRFPAISRHLTILVPDDVNYDRMVENVKASGGILLESVELIDVYNGKGVEDGMKSVTMSFTIRSKEKTLTDEDASTVVNNIISELVSKLGAKFRS